MAARNSWAVSTAGGILTTEDVRLHIAALITPGNTNVKSRIGLRPGASTAAASPGLVAAQGTPNKTVQINAFQAFCQTGRGAGTYIQCLDASTSIDLLTAHPADPSNQRNDLIIAQQDDVSYGDGDNTWTVKQVVGTPSGTPTDPTVTGSTDYYTLARVRVTAGATTITSGMIDDLRPPWAVGLGGVLPVKSSTDRGTLTPYDGMTIWRIDRKWIEVYSIAAGGWLVQGVGICSSTSDATTAITTPLTGQQIVINKVEYVYDGSGWVVMPGQSVGGQTRITASVAVAGTETVVADTGSIALDANSIYKVTFDVNGDVSAASCDFDLRIRETNVSGTNVKEQVMPTSQNAYPLGMRISLIYITTTAISKEWVGTVQRITGTGTLACRAGTYIQVEKVGYSGLMSTV